MVGSLLTHICVTRPQWVKRRIWARSESRCTCYCHCYVTMCPATTGIVTILDVKGRGARDRILGTFKCSKDNFTTMKHVYNESANSSAKAMLSNLASMDHRISLKWWQWVVWRVWYRATIFVTLYTRHCLTLGICSLIKRAALVKLKTKIHL